MSTSRIIHSYTDWHDVDEESVTIASQGANWTQNVVCGLVDRSLFDDPTNVFGYVASSNI